MPKSRPETRRAACWPPEAPERSVIQMIDGDNRSAIFIPADDSMFGTGRESVRVPIMEDCAEYDSRFAMSAAQEWRTLLHMITDEINSLN